MLALTSAQAHAARAGRRAARRGADHPVRPPRAQARAREPGPRRRRRRVRRRGAARDPHRAGVRPRGPRTAAQFGDARRGAFATARRRIRQRALLVAAVILLVFGAVGVILWIGGHDVVAGRLSAPDSCRRSSSTRCIVASAVGHDQRGDRRPAARGRRDRAPVRAARDRARRSARPRNPVPLPDAGARARCAFDDVTFHYPSRPDAPALDRLHARRARRARSVALVGPVGRRQDDGVPAAAALLRSAARAASASTASTSRAPIRATCARALARRAAGPGDLRGQRRSRTCATAGPTRATTKCAPPARRPTRPSSSSGCREGFDTLPRRARRAAVRRTAPAPRDRARDPRRPARSCCSTRRRARSTRRASAWCSSRSSG